MKFTVAGSKVICSRIDMTIEGDDKHRDVVEFDEQVDSVPPHVAARLTKGEVEELEQFLADRRRLKADPAEINMLEALPELVDEVTDVLRSAERLNIDLYEKIAEAVASLQEALKEVRPKEQGKVTPIRGMRSSEILKQRLENIKQDLRHPSN
jgi:type I site-specific restriction endonuclease